jgi:hypothetical protein
LLSAASGIDVDASMRYTSVLSQILDIERGGIMAFFPHIAWGLKAVPGAGTIASNIVGVPHTAAEMDAAVKATVPKGWVGGVADTVLNRGDKMTAMGTRNAGGVERGTEEAVAKWLGTRSLKEAQVSQKVINNRFEDQIRTKDLIRAAQLYTNGHQEKAIQMMVKHEKDPSAAVNSIINQIKAENTPALFRGAVGQGGKMSYEQQRAWQKHGMTQFMRNHENE